MGKGGRAAAGRQAAVATKAISWEELSQHNTKDDAWIAWAGKVYDVSGWNKHPGGDVIFTHAGKDATGVFEGFHPESAYGMMDTYCIGTLTDGPHDKWAGFEADIREVRATLDKEGFFSASPLYYLYKTSTTVAFAVASVWMVLSYDSFAAHMVAAALMATFFQQCGWLAHDYLHHQVFEWRLLGDMAGWVIGNVFQGFSVDWWKNKHNTHHSIPNTHESEEEAHDGDPDIDTMPLLAWSEKLLAKGPSKWHRFQHLAFFVLVMGARLAWAHQSLLHAFGVSPGWGRPGRSKPMPLGVVENVGLILHWVWYAALMACMPWTHALAFTVVAQAGAGVMLAVAFAVGHNGMVIYEYANPPPFSVYQITTTRNVHDWGLNGWFMGGLHYQVEHHLFPTLPRHSLWKAAELVKPICAKHGVPYKATGLWEGTLEVVGALHTIGQAVQDFPAM